MAKWMQPHPMRPIVEVEHWVMERLPDSASPSEDRIVSRYHEHQGLKARLHVLVLNLFRGGRFYLA